MTPRSWERARWGAASALGLTGLLAAGLYMAPMPPPSVALERPPPPPMDQQEELAADYLAADQARGIRALDRILEDRMLIEAAARGVEPVFPSAEARAGDDEALLVAWGEAFRAIGVDDFGELATSTHAP